MPWLTNLLDPNRLLLVGGLLHFAILLASAMVPQVLDWKDSLRRLDTLTRQLVWVHGAFIVLVIVGFGVLSVAFSEELASGSPLARGVCGLIAVFWGARLAVQFFIFDAAQHLSRPLLKVGYHMLTLVFVYHTVVYAAVALLPRSGG